MNKNFNFYRKVDEIIRTNLNQFISYFFVIFYIFIYKFLSRVKNIQKITNFQPIDANSFLKLDSMLVLCMEPLEQSRRNFQNTMLRKLENKEKFSSFYNNIFLQIFNFKQKFKYTLQNGNINLIIFF